MKKNKWLFLLSLLTTGTGFSQHDPGSTITLPSAILKETRTVQLYNPASSSSAAQQYPVLYVLDGGSLYWPVLGAAKFMHAGSSLPQAPEAIIVSVLNTNRDRDMPVPQEMVNNKNAANFLRFLTEELVPYINQHYPVNGLNVLIGHSQGGLFATYAGIQQPAVFPFILSLDAPVTVNPVILQQYLQQLKDRCPVNYFSGESRYGWDKNLSLPARCTTWQQQKIEGETHETMPYTGIYEGLKFLFREHIPSQKDIQLAAMQAYYKKLSEKYNCRYPIPAALLLASANQQINVSKKQEALALLAYYEKTYGADQRSDGMLLKANAITSGPDERVDYYLMHPGSTAEVLQPFMGKWKGTLYVPGGTDMDITWEIKKINDKYTLDARVADAFNDRSHFLLVTAKNELAWGRRHEGGGIYLSIGRLSADGQVLSGQEELIGFKMPDGIPPMKPNTFTFKRVSK